MNVISQNKYTKESFMMIERKQKNSMAKKFQVQLQFNSTGIDKVAQANRNKLVGGFQKFSTYRKAIRLKFFNRTMIETKQQARFIIRGRQSFQQFQFLLHRLLLLLHIPPLTSRPNIIPQITVIAEPRRTHSPTTNEPQSTSFCTNRTTGNGQGRGAPTGI